MKSQTDHLRPATDPQLTSTGRATRPIPRRTASSKPSMQRLQAGLAKRAVGGGKLLIILPHPFCNTICFIAPATRSSPRTMGASANTRKYLAKEIEMQAACLRGRQVTQLHSAGARDLLSHDDARAHGGGARALHAGAQRRILIEVDPRKVDFDTVKLLAELGFNRMSVACRISPRRAAGGQSHPELRRDQVGHRRRARQRLQIGEHGPDLRFALAEPDQLLTARSGPGAEISPDRILHSYAHLPGPVQPQRRINSGDMPTADTKLALLQLGIRRLTTEAGYVYIGMDHFCQARRRAHHAQRQAACTATSRAIPPTPNATCSPSGVGDRQDRSDAQNVKSLGRVLTTRLTATSCRCLRGIELTADDLLRRARSSRR